MRSGRSRSLYLFIRRAIEQIVVIMGTYHMPYTILSTILLLSRLTPYVEEIVGDRQRGI